MIRFKQVISFLFLLFIIVSPIVGLSQITSEADAVIPTAYSSSDQDSIHIFCGNQGEVNASLTATALNGETASYEWSKYNTQSGTFDLISNDISGAPSHTITDLQDGGYRVKITSASGEQVYTAWVFNNYIAATGDISESDCTSFLLTGSFESPLLSYTDLSNGQTIELNKDIKVEWQDGPAIMSRVLSFRNYEPPAKDTDYIFEVTDRFGCVGTANVYYESIVTTASFDADYENPEKPEAPLTVTFTNTSENGDAGKFEWFIFKDLQKIKEEVIAGTFTDSIMDVIRNDSFDYTFEATGEYNIKLVSTHTSEFFTCTDTFYIPEPIVMDSSFIEAPNFFTPNNDLTNDIYAIKFFSMKTVKITIFNRWGKIIHKWESNNVRGFFNTASPEGSNYDVASVWDGKIGGKFASPGVYYYVAEGVGRDDKRKKANGFFHLFRDK